MKIQNAWLGLAWHSLKFDIKEAQYLTYKV